MSYDYDKLVSEIVDRRRVIAEAEQLELETNNNDDDDDGGEHGNDRRPFRCS